MRGMVETAVILVMVAVGRAVRLTSDVNMREIEAVKGVEKPQNPREYLEEYLEEGFDLNSVPTLPTGGINFDLVEGWGMSFSKSSFPQSLANSSDHLTGAVGHVSDKSEGLDSAAFRYNFGQEDGLNVCRDANANGGEIRKCFRDVLHQETCSAACQSESKENFEYKPSKKVALLLKGGGFRSGFTNSLGSGLSNAKDMQHAIYLSHQKNIINKFQEHGYTVDTYIATWQPPRINISDLNAKDFLMERYKPKAIEVWDMQGWNTPAPHGIPADDSDGRKNVRLCRNAVGVLELMKQRSEDYKQYDLVILMRLDALIGSNFIGFFSDPNKNFSLVGKFFTHENIQVFRPCMVDSVQFVFQKGCVYGHPGDFGYVCANSLISMPGVSTAGLRIQTVEQIYWRDGKVFYPPADIGEEIKSAGKHLEAGRAWLHINKDRGADMEHYATALPEDLWELAK
ncbi:hypothetical protein AAMO2058_000508300 [Amorphochlora amoebiformis]